MASDLPILVTGASGFIGGRIVEAAYRTGVANVLAGIRQWAGAARLCRLPVRMARCDILDPVTLREVMPQVRAVIHCAVGDAKVTVDGTRNVMEAAAKAGLEHVVHLSTVDVYGAATGDVDETRPVKSMGTSYSAMKIEAEGIVQQHIERGLPATILRPSIVYGPGSAIWTVRPAQRIRRGCWGRLGPLAEGTCNLVYVDDVAMAALRIVGREEAKGEAFNVNGPETMTWDAYHDLLCQALFDRPLKAMSPTTLAMKVRLLTPVRTGARMLLKRYRDAIFKVYATNLSARGAMQATEKLLGDTPTASELALYRRVVRFRTDKLEALGLGPRIGPGQGVPASAAWLRHHLFEPPTAPEAGAAS